MRRKRKVYGPEEVVREGKRILRKLQARGSYLARLDPEATDSVSFFGVLVPQNNFRRPTIKVEEAFVDLFASEGWIETTKDGMALSKGGVTLLKRQSAGDDPFREQHQLRRRKLDKNEGGIRRSILVNDGESPLGWLRKRKGRNGAPLIDEFQFEAGERLRYDFWQSQMTPRITTNWTMSGSSKRGRRAAPDTQSALRDGVIAAKRRILKALDAVGPELSGVVLDVCCHLQGLEEAEKSHGWPQRSGKVVLQIALTRLARHYGLLHEPKISHAIRSRIRHWGGDNYRPTLESWI